MLGNVLSHLDVATTLRDHHAHITDEETNPETLGY